MITEKEEKQETIFEKVETEIVTEQPVVEPKPKRKYTKRKKSKWE